MNAPATMVCVRIDELPECFVYHFAHTWIESPSLQRRSPQRDLFVIGQRCTVAQIVADVARAAKAGIA